MSIFYFNLILLTKAKNKWLFELWLYILPSAAMLMVTLVF